MATVKALMPSGRVAVMGRVGQFPSHRAARDFILDRTRDGRLHKRFGITLIVDTRDPFDPRK